MVPLRPHPPSSFQWNLKMSIINSPNTLRLSFNFLGACREILFVSSCIEFCCWMWWREIKKNKKKVVEVPKAPEMNHRTHYFLKKKEWVGPGQRKLCIKHDLQLSCCIREVDFLKGENKQELFRRYFGAQQPAACLNTTTKIPFLAKIGFARLFKDFHHENNQESQSHMSHETNPYYFPSY